MATGIKPGKMGLPTVPPDPPTTPTVFADSMAAEMEQILNQLLAADGLRTLPDDNSKESRDRRRLFVAIARGIVKHLDQKRTHITVRVGGSDYHPEFTIDGRDW